MTETKSIKLDSILTGLRSFVIALSGGVDSSFLAYRSKTLEKVKMTAVTIRTPYIPDREIDEAIEFTRTYGIDHQIINISFPEVIKHNPSDRCYLCKKILFTRILDFAEEHGYKFVADGTNADDKSEYRPGMRALGELSVRSPLAEAGMTKSDIRELMKKEGLAIWNKPSLSCLLTRLPYDTEVGEDMLRMIEKAEGLLFEEGFPGTRVRAHGDIARIECLPGYIEKIVNNPNREVLISNLKKIGFRYISLDLEGYRTGSMNHDKHTK